MTQPTMPVTGQPIQIPVPTRGQFFDDLARVVNQGSAAEDECIGVLAELRWPNGVTCPKCESTNIGRIETRRLFDCAGCGYQFSVRVGTVLQDSKLPLWKWVHAWTLIQEPASANEIGRQLGVTTKTACYMRRKLCQLAGVGTEML